MATAKRRFVQARNFTRGRDSSIDILVIHTMENKENPESADNIANWFAGSSAPEASAHYCIDNNSVIQCVRDEDVAWHAPGANHDGLGFEHAGTAKQTGRDWDDDYSQSMLDLSAELVAEKCVQYRIPPVWLTPADIEAGRRGITSHNNVSKAFGKSTHWDPGVGFNIQRYLRRVRKHMGSVDVQQFKPDPPVLREGDRGWRVKKLQQRLKLHGFGVGEIDGALGPQTEKQVKAFQQAHDIEVDGIVGPMTWKMLNKAPQT
jgi:N-acetyl-anhydromuramyl-L-alanine amidase AmpD